MIKVSIIMPSFNVAPYIRECMESVINQTIKEIEIICVDAYSTDGTREILEEYANRDRRIKLLNDDGRSTGYAFNLALKHAAGKYIGIVETDDYVSLKMYEELYHAAESNDVDYVKADFNLFLDLEEGRFILPFATFTQSDRKYYNQVINPKNCPMLRVNDGYMWKGIYRKDFLLNHKVRMHETKGASFQDQGFLYQTIFQAEKILYLDRNFYFYRRDNAGSSVYSEKIVDKMMTEYKLIEEDFKSNPESLAEFKEDYYFEKFARYKGVLKCIKTESRSLYLQEIKNEFVEPFKEGYVKKDMGYVYQDLVLLLNSPVMYNEELEKESLIKLDQSIRLLQYADGKDIVLFGDGEIGIATMYLLRRFHKGNVLCMMDNNQNKWGRINNGTKVVSPTEINQYIDKHFIITNQNHTCEIYKQLMDAGIASERIYIQNMPIDLHEITAQNYQLEVLACQK